MQLSQETIAEILRETSSIFAELQSRDTVPYLVHTYARPENMLTKKSKIERFMDNMTPNLIDEKRGVFHFNPNGDTPIFLLLDSDEKKAEVNKFLEEIRPGWERMFIDYPTVKTYTEYSLPDEFLPFTMDANEVKSYLPDAQIIDGKVSLAEEKRIFFDKSIREQISKDLSFDINQLGPEQAYLVGYMAGKNGESFKKIIDFAKVFGEQGIKTFLSISSGGQSMGDKILLLGEKLSPESAQSLFGTYGKIVDAASDVADIVRENLGDHATSEIIQNAKEKLLVRGKNLLEEYAEKVLTCQGVTCDDIGRELLEELELAKTSAFAFSEVCKILVDRGEFSFEDFKDIELAYSRSPLPEKMVQEIAVMHRENTKQYPEGLREYWRGTLRDGLEKENPKQMIVSVKYKGDVIAVMRVIQQENGSWYGASFNVNPTVRGSRIGTELLKKVIDELAQDAPFVADCYSENPMLQTYIEKFGFVITDTRENYHDTGATVHEITLSR